MKFAKIGQFFKKSNIPQSLIDSVVSDLSNKFEVSVEKLEIKMDAVKISCKTEIGQIDLVISLRKNRGIFRSNDIIIYCCYGEEISMNEIDTKTGELGSLNKYIEYTIDKLIKQNKSKKDFEDFYKKELVDGIKDSLINLYNMLGIYKMEKRIIGDKRGFFIEFNNVPGEFIKASDFDRKCYFESSPKHMGLLNEIHNLYMALKDTYGLTTYYNLHNGLELIILQDF